MVGNLNGKVGLGFSSSKELISAVQRSSYAALNSLKEILITGHRTISHKIQGNFGSSRVLLRPAREGTGVVAGGSSRVVVHLSGLRNVYGKQLGSRSPLGNARATLSALASPLKQ